MYQLSEIHISILTNPSNNFDKSNLNKIQQEQWWTFSDKARQWSDLGQYNNEIWNDRRFDLQLQILLRCTYVVEVKCISWHLLHLEKRICIYTVSNSMWNLPFISNKNFLKKSFHILLINISSRLENILFPWIFATLDWIWVLESVALMANLWRIPPLQNWII